MHWPDLSGLGYQVFNRVMVRDDQGGDERNRQVDEAGNLVIGRQALVHAVQATPGHPVVTGIISFDGQGDWLP